MALVDAILSRTMSPSSHDSLTTTSPGLCGILAKSREQLRLSLQVSHRHPHKADPWSQMDHCHLQVENFVEIQHLDRLLLHIGFS